MTLSEQIAKSFFNTKDLSIVNQYTIDKLNIEKTTPKQLRIGDIFYGSISTTVKKNGKRMRLSDLKGVYKVINILDKILVENLYNVRYTTSYKAIKIKSQSTHFETEIASWYTEFQKQKEKEKEKEFNEQIKTIGFSFTALPAEKKIVHLISNGIKNIWMVGPTGCGKSTMARNASTELNIPYLCISCGIGTSATEFVGYKYPTREKTAFAEFYAKPSIILIDEMTALDPSVAQILNAALANDEIQTTTGLVHRHPECIIIATSNTFGSGTDRQYVANNQLDSSTIDRFIGGVIEVSYSEDFESQYDSEVVSYVQNLRKAITSEKLRRFASTRMIQSGHILKRSYILDWKDILINSWSDTEKQAIKQYLKNE